ncbi:MAG: glycosyltransferase family A protein [Bacteroidota bacterium]|nr:glycosyltransferase family A protein [Bacteroidota bacterium]
MKISLIIPVYNASAYLNRCLEAVTRQTYTDFECILVNDCCLDDSQELISDFITRYPGPVSFILLNHSSNKGAAAARNSGIHVATGQYVFFQDVDDVMTENCLETLAGVVSSHPAVDMVQGNAAVIRNGKLDSMYQLNGKLPEFSDNSRWVRQIVMERKLVPVTPWNKLINRSFLIENQLLFKEGIMFEDELWGYETARKIGSIAFSWVHTYDHYINKGSVMSSDAHKQIQDWFVVIETCIHQTDEELLPFQRKVILEMSFCNLVRIVKKASASLLPDMLYTQRQLLRTYRACLPGRPGLVERYLQAWFWLPLPMLKVLCTRKIRGLFFKPLTYLM